MQFTGEKFAAVLKTGVMLVSLGLVLHYLKNLVEDETNAQGTIAEEDTPTSHPIDEDVDEVLRVGAPVSQTEEMLRYFNGILELPPESMYQPLEEEEDLDDFDFMAGLPSEDCGSIVVPSAEANCHDAVDW